MFGKLTPVEETEGEAVLWVECSVLNSVLVASASAILTSRSLGVCPSCVLGDFNPGKS